MADGYKNGQPDVRWWMSQINAGISYRKKAAYQSSWKVWRNYYRGRWSRRVMPSNLFFKMLRTVVPRIYFRNPSISITANRPGIENIIFAQLLERIDNRLIINMGLKREMKRQVAHTFAFGSGFMKLGFGAQFTPTPDGFDTSAPLGRSGEQFEYSERIFPNMPWVRASHPGVIVLPSGCTLFEDARWIAHHIRRPLVDVKADPRFKHTAGLKGSNYNNAGVDISDVYRNPTEMIDLYEVRDKKYKTVFVIAPYVESQKAIFMGDDELQIGNSFPFFMSVFNEDDEYVWGTPDSKILEPQQLELNEINTQIMYHRRISLARIIAKKGGISETEAMKLISEDVFPIIWSDDDPSNAIKILEGNNIPSELFKAKQETMVDGRESIGFGRNQFGEFKPGSGDTTATEANIVAMASEIRVDERRDMMADVMVDIVNHMHHIIFNRWSGETVIDIVGPNGYPIWVKFKPEVLRAGNYAVNIDPDSSLPETKAMRQDRVMKLYATFNQDPMIDQVKLRRILLGEMGDGNMIDLLNPMALGGASNPMTLGQAQQHFQQQLQARSQQHA